ncbi:hypothetical protein [[Mycobacterium] zoologicum]
MRIRSVARVFAVPVAAAALMAGGLPAIAGAHPGFPDLSGFSPVAVDDYFVSLRPGTARMVNFSTPYNTVCNFYGGESAPTGPTQGLHCQGEMPGMQEVPFLGSERPAAGDCVVGAVNAAGSGYQLTRMFYGGCDGNPPAPPFGGKLLGVGQKLTYLNVTCGVGANQLVACSDTTSGDHGFVLQPSGSTAF